jgi:uncharacterized protein
MRSTLVLVFATTCAAAWVATHDLHLTARLWTVMLLVPLPAFAIWQARSLPDPSVLPRQQVYLSTIVSLWTLALATAAVAWHADLPLAALGLFSPGIGPILAWGGGATGVGLALILIARALGIRETRLLAHLLPRSAAERSWFAALSITAGATEEFIFRGFLFATLLHVTSSPAAAALLSAAAFGIVHAYQDPAGAARAACLGVVLTAPVLDSGSILPSMLAHASLDLIAGLVMGHRLLRD